MRFVPRWAHRFYADLFGYFWESCPSCDQKFGGHEVREIRGHRDTRPGEGTELQIICPRCTAAGVGCVAHAQKSLAHAGCPYAPITLESF